MLSYQRVSFSELNYGHNWAQKMAIFRHSPGWELVVGSRPQGQLLDAINGYPLLHRSSSVFFAMVWKRLKIDMIFQTHLFLTFNDFQCWFMGAVAAKIIWTPPKIQLPHGKNLWACSRLLSFGLHISAGKPVYCTCWNMFIQWVMITLRYYIFSIASAELPFLFFVWHTWTQEKLNEHCGGVWACCGQRAWSDWR